MPLGDGALGSIGNSLFNTISQDLNSLLAITGEVFPVTRHSAATSHDIYGVPEDAPRPFNVTLLLIEQDLKEKPTEAGGKRYEVLTLIGQPGTLLESDILAYSGHNYDVYAVMKSTLGGPTLGGTVQAEVYEAQREVDV